MFTKFYWEEVSKAIVICQFYLLIRLFKKSEKYLNTQMQQKSNELLLKMLKDLKYVIFFELI